MPGVKSTKIKNKLWEKDGLQGGRSSIQILLDWLCIKNNYARWCGQGPSHQSKEYLAREIHQQLVKGGITTRSPKNIRSKMEYLETRFRKAYVWKTRIGKSIYEKAIIKYQGNEEKANKLVQVKLMKICPYWDVLLPIFGNHASMLDNISIPIEEHEVPLTPPFSDQAEEDQVSMLQVKRDLLHVKSSKLALLQEKFVFEKRCYEEQLQLEQLRFEYEQMKWHQAQAFTKLEKLEALGFTKDEMKVWLQQQLPKPPQQPWATMSDISEVHIE